jgi:hemolysin D
MNMHASVPTPKRKADIKRRRADQQFLPGALEVLETPPAPLATTIILVICLFFIVAIGWAYFSRIDIIAIAQGKFQPAGRVKTVQSLETGRVVLNKVENGQHVKAGDILLALDPNGIQAEQGAVAADLAAFQAEVVRRSAAIGVARSGHLDRVPAVDWPSEVSEVVRNREQRVIAADVMQLASQMALFDSRQKEKTAERSKLSATIKAQQSLIEILNERVAMRERLKDTAAFSKSNVLDATEMLRTQQATLVQEIGQIGEIDADLAVIDRDSLKAIQTFIADNAQRLEEAERQVATLTKKLAQADTKLDNLTIRSPIDGIVYASAVTTNGQVVSPGEELMRIVPDETTLEIETYLPNKDIGFVKVGQKALIKIESFPFTRYGTVDAIVTRVARDAIPEPDAAQTESEPSRLRRNNMPAGADRVQNLVFPVTLKPLKTSIDVDGTTIPLGAGMAITAEIRTGSRRILDYLFSPLIQIGSEAMRER